MRSDFESIDRLKRVFAKAGALWSGGADATLPGDLACRSGCFGCCVGLFDISLPEAILVRHGLSSLPETEKAEIVARAERIVRETGARFPGDVETGILDPDRSEEADDRYFDLVADRACPMLALPSGRCRIYDSRPLTCRIYGLAWTRDGEVVHPPCGLNLPGASADRQLETGVDLGRLDGAESEAARIAAELSLPPGAETTVAHAVTGRAFGRAAG